MAAAIGSLSDGIGITINEIGQFVPGAVADAAWRTAKHSGLPD
jgi:hypothetical protein